MEVSPSLVGGRLVLDDVDVGELREVGEDVVRPKVKMPLYHLAKMPKWWWQ